MALQLRALAAVCVNISLNLHILDYIRRKDFVTAEPRRLAFMGVAWFIGPGLGIWLHKTVGLLAVCIPSATFAVLTLAYFWVLWMQENPAAAPATRKPPMPFLRSAHPYERSEMTSVFRTYIEMSQPLPAAIYAGLLLVFPVGAVFVALGTLMIVTASLATYLPWRL